MLSLKVLILLHTEPSDRFVLLSAVFHLTRQDMGTVACSLNYKDFTKHMCIGIYDFTLTMDGTIDPMVPLLKGGHLKVTVDWKKSETLKKPTAPTEYVFDICRHY